MCGIAGFLNFDGTKPSREVLSAMTHVLSHRGPDGEGFQLVDSVALGHRRLSIIDLKGGAQPMVSANNRFVITFNGEIFNYLELREELEEKGSKFRTQSDTEVLLEAFSHYGPFALGKLNGQFAFAIYDIHEKKLFLARDRMGEKPLYYAHYGKSFVFASELKSILIYAKAFGVPNGLSLQSFFSYLSLNYVPFDGTFAKEIFSLSAASWMEVQNGKVQKKIFWEPDIIFNPRKKNEALAEVRTSLDDAVKIRLRSDVPVGIFLSGGIDSTTLACSIASQNSNIKAFIADFQEQNFSEASSAVRVCQNLGIPHEVFKINPRSENIPGLIEQLVYHADEPLADSSSLAVYLLSRCAARSVKVVLSGDGGDELFGGYLTYRATLLAKRIPRFFRYLSPGVSRLLAVLPASDRKIGFLEKLDRFTRNLELPPGLAHFAWNGMFSAKEKERLIHPDLLHRNVKLDIYGELASAFHVDRDNPSLSQLLLADQRGYLESDTLQKMDRMSMAHGLEVRSPFMDYRLVEFARSLDPRFQIRGNTTKVLLREFLKMAAPWYPLSQMKQGFSIPVHHWFRTVLREFAGDLFHSEFVKQTALYNVKYLRTIWNAHQNRQRNLGFELWGVMVSLLWIRKFLH